MKFVISLFLFFVVQFGFSQTNSKSLKKEQQQLESKISNTKKLLKQVKSNQQNSLNAIRLIDNQIKSREDLVRIYDIQVRAAEIEIIEKKQRINRLKERISNLKTQFRSMMLYSYKHRGNHRNIMFILSSQNYNEAYKRNSYLKKLAEIQKKQVAIIKQNQKVIYSDIQTINNNKQEKLSIIEEKKTEKKLIEIDRGVKQQTFNKFKQEEKNLFTQLEVAERKKQNLKQEITKAIKLEILIEQKKQEEIAKKERAKKEKAEKEKAEKLANEEKTIGNAEPKKENLESKSIENTENKIVSTYTEPKESIALGKNFQLSKGLLPWPVNSGSITEKYGKNPHPTLNGVITNNNGIDITCSIGSNVRAVFGGEVSSIFSIQGAGKVIIVKHGNYRSVYSNIKDTYVKIGAKVATKQNIGSLIQEGNLSICHFEIHQVVNGVTQSLNPSLWISK
ncbi:MAG: peptidoglycan DD-metalloendopeptidase family protein [Flavobacteriia bacterium]|nr:peptidoglycan DD-metalloendopeptidase family protein [Flavobacteriia bacterium]